MTNTNLLSTCCLCGQKFKGFGNNPSPVMPANFACCDECNEKRVIPARLAMYAAKAGK